jgi:hypothetical protein
MSHLPPLLACQVNRSLRSSEPEPSSISLSVCTLSAFTPPFFLQVQLAWDPPRHSTVGPLPCIFPPTTNLPRAHGQLSGELPRWSTHKSNPDIITFEIAINSANSPSCCPRRTFGSPGGSLTGRLPPLLPLPLVVWLVVWGPGLDVTGILDVDFLQRYVNCFQPNTRASSCVNNKSE